MYSFSFLEREQEENRKRELGSALEAGRNAYKKFESSQHDYIANISNRCEKRKMLPLSSEHPKLDMIPKW